MTTVATLIQDAMFQAEILGQDQTPSSGDTQLVLRRLQRMLDSWATESLMVYATTRDQFTMAAGVASYSSTLLANGRPVSVDSMYVRLSNIDFTVDLVDSQTYDAIPYKPTTGIPSICYIDMGYPDATFYFYPTPYAAFTCFVQTRRLLASALGMASDLTLPAGYEKAIVDNLAVDISPSWGKKPTPDMYKSAVDSKTVLKRANYQPLEMDTGLSANKPSPDAFIYRGF